MTSLFISVMILFTICAHSAELPGVNNSHRDTCRTWADAERLKNTDALIIGRLQKFTPWEKGKGAGHMFWQYEIKLSDSTAIPVVNMDKSDGESIVFDEYLNTEVVIYGKIFYGIIIGDSDPNHQSMTGYRIDADGIMPVETGYENELKIKIDLSEFNDEGYRVRPDGEKSATHYEFCIPASDSIFAEVKSMDPMAEVMKGSKGRSGCTDQEWLVISATRKPGFKEIIKKQAALPYVRKITETFWE